MEIENVKNEARLTAVVEDYLMGWHGASIVTRTDDFVEVMNEKARTLCRMETAEFNRKCDELKKSMGFEILGAQLERLTQKVNVLFREVFHDKDGCVYKVRDHLTCPLGIHIHKIGHTCVLTRERCATTEGEECLLARYNKITIVLDLPTVRK